MKKSIEFKLKINRSTEKTLLKLLDKGKNIYNLALSESKKRLNKIRTDQEYINLLNDRRTLKKLNKHTTGIDKQLNSIIKVKYLLTTTDIEKYVKDNSGYLVGGLNSQFAQVLADRAVEATLRIIYGKAKRVRFKNRYDNILASLHAKSTKTGIFFNHDTKCIEYGKKVVPLAEEYRNDHGYHEWYLSQITDNIENHNAVDISYIRIVRRLIKGKNVFYAQFVINVRPLGMTKDKVKEQNKAILKHNSDIINKAVIAGKDIKRIRLKPFMSDIEEYPKTSAIIEQIKELGLYKEFQVAFDMGPKHMAAFFRNDNCSIALFQPVFDKLREYGKEMAVLQRRLDRSRRATNPDNYNKDGTVKKKKNLKWFYSQSYKVTRQRIRELHRITKETRKTVLNELSSIIIALGHTFKTEKNSVMSWQKNYGKSVGVYSPSYFIKNVYSKAENAGNERVEIPLKNALSQHCVCSARKKKALSERVHSCDCGCTSQRDVLSAYLGLYCNPDLDGWESIARNYHNADRQLLAASYQIYKGQTAKRQKTSFALCLDMGHQSCSCGKTDRQSSENYGGVVTVSGSLKSLIGELGPGGTARLSVGIPRL